MTRPSLWPSGGLEPNMARTLYTSRGNAVAVGRELGKGGEGSVFEVPALSNQVAKIYHKAPDRKKQAKLSFMASTADAQLLNYVAWPQETLHLSRGGPVVGFLMPMVSDRDPIHMVYSPAHRRQDYPKAAWDFLLYLARNIAASFETVHSHGHVIGDVNQNSFMVGRDSKVVLIDSDSFQVNARGTMHLCEVGVSHFTPPELQSLSSFDGFTRTTNHDNFGLALLIFHVLFGGRHPYSGVPLRNGVGDALETDINNFRYAYARDNQSRGVSPPPRSIPVSMLPDAMESMFHFAFTEKGASGARPTAAQWVSALDGLRGRLKKCGTSAMHVYPDRLGSCPWCALEQQGVIYFVDLGTTFTPTSSGFVLDQVWALIQAVPAPAPLNLPTPSGFSVIAKPLPPGIPDERKATYYKLIAVAIAIAIFLVDPGMAAFILAVLIGTVGNIVATMAGSSKRDEIRMARKSVADAAVQSYERLVTQAKKEAAIEGFYACRADLSKAKAELEALPRVEQEELNALHATARQRQLEKFLNTCFIDRASIPGLGPARKASLRSFGIETAADVTRSRVMQVHGFGESLTRAVVDWRRSCERQFHFNPAAAVSQSDRDSVRAKLAVKRIALEQRLSAGPGQLQQLRQRILTQTAALMPQLQDAARKLAQAQADLGVL
jgi:DNA-binding helix-hairpin-helix protein with protein kinase domain